MFHYGASGDTNFSPHLSPLPPASPAEGGSKAWQIEINESAEKVVGEAAGRRGWGEKGGRTLFTCISLFLSLFTSSSPAFLFDKIMKYTWLLLPTTFIEWWQRWNWQGPFIARWPFVYAEIFVGPISQILPSLACEDQKKLCFLTRLGLNFHIHSGRDWRSLWKVMLLMQEKFDSLTPADQRYSVGYRGSSQCLPVLVYVTHFETMSK